MIERLSKIIASKGKWHSGSPTNLSFKSAKAYPELKDAKEPSDGFLDSLKLSKSQLNDPVLLKLAAAAEKLFTKGSKQ